MKLMVPAKSFLLGEYIVLSGGPAIIAATPPCFSYDTDQSQFEDPYQGIGGFGASGAKFVFQQQIQGVKDPWEIWRRYCDSGLKGSGADVVAQSLGGIVFFHAAEKRLEKLSWPFMGIVVVLIHTGEKLATHEHLASYDKAPQKKLQQDEYLSEIVLSAYDALKKSRQNQWLQSINAYNEQLRQYHLVAEHSELLLEKINARSEVLASKGCGAMGHDVVLAVIKTSDQINFLRWAKKEGINIIFCGNQFYESV